MSNDNRFNVRGLAEFMAMCILVYVVLVMCGEVVIGEDDSDSPDGSSGMHVYRDHLTGCEYLASGPWPFTLTPRMWSDGKQVCR